MKKNNNFYMHKLIHEFAEEAGIAHLPAIDPKNHCDLYECADFQLEKFARLIVEECAQIARDTNLEDVEGGDSAVLWAASDQIERYFGFND